jgi:hypothetical protein
MSVATLSQNAVEKRGKGEKETPSLPPPPLLLFSFSPRVVGEAVRNQEGET